MALKLSKKAGTATETVEQKVKGKVISEESKSETVDIPVEVSAEVSDGELCRVGFEASYTHNLGDYKSARVAWTLTVPCTHAEIDQVADYASEWVDARLSKSVNDLVNN